MLFRRVFSQVRRPESSFLGANAVQRFEEIPFPKGLPIVGTMLSLIKAGSTPKLHRYVDSRHKTLGPIYRERIGPVECVFIAEPEGIRSTFNQEGKYPMHVLPEAWMAYNKLYGCQRGLLFMDGPNWWHHRRIMNRLLMKGDLAWIENACDCVSDKLIGQVHDSVDKNYVKNIESILYKWSLDVLVALLLGSETYRQSSQGLEEEVTKLAQTIQLVFETSAKLALIPAELASKLNIPRWRDFVQSVHDALSSTKLVVKRLRELKSTNTSGLLNKMLNEDISIENVERIIVDLILAAGDTTAVAMEWMLYATARNPEVQEAMRVNGDFVKLVFKETLRLYPVAPFLTRILPEDSVLCGYSVPKETLVVLSIYTTGRDERYFKNPNEFQPTRWDRHHNEDYIADMQKASLPFAMGLRACIGRKIAETQIQMTLQKIVNNFRVAICNENEIDIQLKMVAVPSEPLQLKFTKLL